MQKSLSLISVILFLTATTIRAVNNSTILFNDDFSTPLNWKTQGSGEVNVDNGVCNLNHVHCGNYNRIYQLIGHTLPGSGWRTECKFSILGNNDYGEGTGVVIVALTAGNKDFMSYDGSQNYLETVQDGIAAVLYSSSSSDNDISHWYFMIEGKKGNIRTFDQTSVIYADPLISTYYVRLERIAADMSQLSVFSDPSFQIPLPGSPVSFAIDPSIGRLTTIQHGSMTPGWYSRSIFGTIDNDNIYEDEQAVSIAESIQSGKGLTVYPNPSSTTISVADHSAIPGEVNAFYRIFNSQGVEMMSSFLDRTRRIDISALMEGAFILVVSEAGKTLSIRFMKAH